jgi:hypothetical protein
MTLGLEVIKFMLEQDPDNLPIVQRWIDKWFWRGYRVLTLVAMMMDYMLPKRVMSWKEAWEIYAEENGGALFRPGALRHHACPRAGSRSPAKDKDHLSHQAWAPSTTTRAAAVPHLDAQTTRKWTGCRAKYPTASTSTTGRAYEHWREQAAKGNRFYNKTLPMLCQTCQIPMLFTEPATRPRSATARATTRARSTTSARTAARDLRARAREVHPGLAAGAPDLPGQLLPPEADPTAGLRPAGRRAEVLPHRAWAATTSTSKARETRRTSPPGAAWPRTPDRCKAGDRAIMTTETRHGSAPKYDSPPSRHGGQVSRAQLLYIGWEDHLMFCAPFACPCPPTMRSATCRRRCLAGRLRLPPGLRADRLGEGGVVQVRQALAARLRQVAGRERAQAQGRDPLPHPGPERHQGLLQLKPTAPEPRAASYFGASREYARSPTDSRIRT